MGVLDEAIREHLELKRRRGADAGEISRQESEALGPIRRPVDNAPEQPHAPASQRPDSDDDPPPPASPQPWEERTAVHDAPAFPAYEALPEPPTAAPDRPAYHELPPAPDDEPPPEPGEHESPAPSLLSRLNPATSRIRLGRRRLHDEEPAPPDRHGPGPGAAAFEPPPAAHDSDIVRPDDEPDGEDLLEETPEFLEETPEHDRLWFEQRPPRDFDFDDK